MFSSIKIVRVALAVWLGMLAPLWCCCTEQAVAGEPVLVAEAPTPSPRSGCSACDPSQGQERPAEHHCPDSSEPGDCDQHQMIDVAVVNGPQPLALALEIPFAWDQPIFAVQVFAFKLTTPASRIPPLGSERESLFSLSSLLRV